MSVIYTAHDCEQVGTFLVDEARGSVVRCDECGRYWRRGRSLYTDGFHLEWKRVRWWNYRSQQRIAANTATHG